MAAKCGLRPVIAETPNSISRILDPLRSLDFDVSPVFIIETPEITRDRYGAREGKLIPKQHLSLIKTYTQRAITMGAPHGTSEQILRYLQQV